MREILFRGKRLDNGEWVKGFYAKMPDASGTPNYIIYEPARDPDHSNQTRFVNRESVGQFTGYYDDAGRRIFEGDILEYITDGWLTRSKVFWWDGSWGLESMGLGREPMDAYSAQKTEVIGNIFDDPGLLEEEDVGAEAIW